MLSGDNVNLKIPAAHAVAIGFNGKLTRGFMTHHTDDAPGRKRLATQESNAQYFSGRGNKEKIEVRIIDNKPMNGFKFGTIEYLNGEFQWMIEDPRGFQMTISANNANQIIRLVSTENGEILERCVWGNIGAENVLIPVSSEAYKAAQVNTDRVSTRVNLRTVKPGSKVLTHDAVEGIYLGGMFAMDKAEYSRETPQKFKYSPKRFLLAEVNDDGSWKTLHMYAEIKISKVIEDGNMDVAEAERKVNENRQNCKSHIGYSTPEFFLAKKSKDDDFFNVSYDLKVLTAEEMAELGKTNPYSTAVIELADGGMGTGYLQSVAKSIQNSSKVTITDMNVTDWQTNRNISYIERPVVNSGWYRHRENQTFEIDPLDPTIKLNALVLIATTELGNELRIVT